MSARQNEVKEISVLENGVPRTKYLIAAFHFNSFSQYGGFLLYIADDIINWHSSDSRPVIDTILFPTAEEAFKTGEEIFSLIK